MGPLILKDVIKIFISDPDLPVELIEAFVANPPWLNSSFCPILMPSHTTDIVPGGSP